MQFSPLRFFASRLVPRVLAFGLVAVLGFSSVHCVHKETAAEDADSIFREAEEAFKDERYLIAVEKYRDIKNRYPYSARAKDSELRIADTYFAQESFLEAESAYEIYHELHPTDPKSDYVQYRMALSYFNQIPDSAARDLSPAYKAIEAFEQLTLRYPSSEFAPKAREYIVESRKRLAEQENYVADFYFRREHFLSASYRYAALLKEFPNLGYDEEALYRLGQSYYHIRMFDNAVKTLQQLMAAYPESGHKSDVLALIEDINKKKK